MQEDLKAKIAEQKKHFKDGAKSICRSCVRYNEDCFDTFKACDKDDKNGYSKVTKCDKYEAKK